jgi:hypothetical protein
MSDTPLSSELEQIRLEARLLAIENVLAGLIADINRRNGVSPEQFSAASEEMRQALRQQLVAQGSDHASRLVADEVEQAITALLKKIADCSEIAEQLEEETTQIAWR